MSATGLRHWYSVVGRDKNDSEEKKSGIQFADNVNFVRSKPAPYDKYTLKC